MECPQSGRWLWKSTYKACSCGGSCFQYAAAFAGRREYASDKPEKFGTLGKVAFTPHFVVQGIGRAFKPAVGSFNRRLFSPVLKEMAIGLLGKRRKAFPRRQVKQGGFLHYSFGHSTAGSGPKTTSESAGPEVCRM